jgi:hypothetical protein
MNRFFTYLREQSRETFSSALGGIAALIAATMLGAFTLRNAQTVTTEHM